MNAPNLSTASAWRADIGVVNMLLEQFFTAGPDGDLTGDGVVNTADLGALKNSFFAAPGPRGLVR